MWRYMLSHHESISRASKVSLESLKRGGKGGWGGDKAILIAAVRVFVCLLFVIVLLYILLL